MDEVVNNFLLAKGNFMPEMHLKPHCKWFYKNCLWVIY